MTNATQRRYIALDIETVKPFPAGANWRVHRPLGIACVALHSSAWPEPRTLHTLNPDGSIADQMSLDDLQSLVRKLVQWTAPSPEQHILVTWNGLGFDLDVLAEESRMAPECRALAWHHVDLMFHIFCHTGYPVGMATTAAAMGLPGKTAGINGAEACRLWRAGERLKILEYCGQDTKVTLDLALTCEQQQAVHWTSRAGNLNTLALPGGWYKVSQARPNSLPGHLLDDNSHPQSSIHQLAPKGQRRGMTTEIPAGLGSATTLFPPVPSPTGLKRTYMQQERVSDEQLAAYADELCRLINKLLTHRGQALSATIQTLPPETGLAACRFRLDLSGNQTPVRRETVPDTHALILQTPHHLQDQVRKSLTSVNQARVYGQTNGTEQLWIIKSDQSPGWSIQKARVNARDIVDDHITTRLQEYLQPTQHGDLS